jgi:zinc transport system substrate-binding protein
MLREQKLILIGLIFFSILLLACFPVKADGAKKIRIVTSVTPIASIFAAIAGDKAKVSSICVSGQCPAHYLVRPSQLRQIAGADLVVYIDDAFEGFMPRSLQGAGMQILKLSSNPTLRIISNNQINWHLWLSIDNLKAIMTQALLVLSKLEPQSSSVFEDNYKTTYQALEVLQNKMQTNLSKIAKPILLDDSLEYFFTNFKDNDQVFKLYDGSNGYSFAKLEQAKDHIAKTSAKCVFAGAHQDIGRIEDFFEHKVKVIALESESWQEQELYDKLMQIKLQQMMDLVFQCL